MHGTHSFKMKNFLSEWQVLGRVRYRSLANTKYALPIFIQAFIQLFDSQPQHLLHEVPFPSLIIFSFPLAVWKMEQVR